MEKFTDTKIRGWKAKDKPYEVLESDGLYLRVQPSGKKTFYYVFRQGKKRSRVKIGEYPLVSLWEARERHRELRKARERGESPALVKLGGFTVNDLSKRYLSEYSKPTNSERGYADNERMLNNDVLPIIGDMPADDVKRANVQDCLKRTREDGLASAHNHTLTVIRKMFNWGIEMGLVENNPAHLVRTMATTPKDRTLTDDEITGILSDTGGTASILKLCLYTGCRPGEAQNILFSDIDKKWWTCKQIKGGKTSYKRTYLVAEALSLIGEGNGRVFPHQNQQSGVALYVKRKYNQGWTPHDIRRTVASRLAEMGYSEELISRLLGHSQNKLSVTYNRYQYDKEKKNMLLAWEKKLICLKN